MPQKMASDPAALHAFWYKPNVSPPRDYAQWDAMITAFAQHLIERYGPEEALALELRGMERTQHRLLARKARASQLLRALRSHRSRPEEGKLTDSRRRASTAQAAWTGDFLRHCKEKSIPVDFASSHVLRQRHGERRLPYR